MKTPYNIYGNQLPVSINDSNSGQAQGREDWIKSSVESIAAAWDSYRVYLPALMAGSPYNPNTQPTRTPRPTRIRPTPTSTSMAATPTPTRPPSTGTPIPPSACKFTIPTTTALVDGRTSPYNTVLPGDTICVAAGTRGPLQFRNIRGSTDRPIRIVNSGGQVIINNSNGWYGIYLANMQHVRLTGTGSSHQYGFVIQKAVQFGLFISMKSEYYEVDHIEIQEVMGSNIAVHAKTDASCPNPNGRNSDDYDYNGDGRIDSQDMVTRSNFTQHNLVFHDNYIHGYRRSDGSYSIDVAYYVGHSNYSDAVVTRRCTNSDGSTSTVSVVNPVIEGLHIYNDVINNVGNKVLQVGSATRNCEINNVTIDRGAQSDLTDTAGININPGSVCNIHNNRITNVRGTGISYFGAGGLIHNNIIANVGRANSYYHTGIHVSKRPEGYHHYQNTRVFNNTIINTVGYGIAFGYGEGSDDRIQNNIIVNPGAGYSYIYTPAGNFTISNNYQTMNIADVRFADAANGSYALQSSSPAVNAGANLSTYGILYDFFGVARPQGGAFDIGAAEYR